MFLRKRRRRPELMDEPGLDPDQHALALRGLERLNAASRAASSLWRAVADASDPPPGEPLQVLDVASGGGDISRGLARHATRAGVPIEVHGVDFSPTAVRLATQRAAADASLSGVRVTFTEADALRGPLPGGYDVAVSSLFLHHLSEADTIVVLRHLAAAASAVVVSDLRRSVVGYGLAQASCRLLSRSPIVHVDGPRSVEGAYTPAELQELASAAGLSGARVQNAWPQRMVLVWKRVSVTPGPG